MFIAEEYNMAEIIVLLFRYKLVVEVCLGCG
jgi:hypothetical protein